MSHSELVDWLAYARVEPFGDARILLALARLDRRIVSALTKDPPPLGDFLDWTP